MCLLYQSQSLQKMNETLAHSKIQSQVFSQDLKQVVSELNLKPK
jgi:hypothetical protein